MDDHTDLFDALRRQGYHPTPEALDDWLCCAGVPTHLLPAYAAWVAKGACGRSGGGLPDLSEFEEAFCGKWSIFEEYLEELWNDLGYDTEIPAHLRNNSEDPFLWVRDVIAPAGYWTAPAPGHGIYVFRRSDPASC